MWNARHPYSHAAANSAGSGSSARLGLQEQAGGAHFRLYWDTRGVTNDQGAEGMLRFFTTGSGAFTQALDSQMQLFFISQAGVLGLWTQKLTCHLPSALPGISGGR